MKTDNRGRIVFGAWAAALIFWLILIALASLAQFTTVFAQTDTPTPEPTADIDYIIELSTGSEVVITRSVDYGQIAIVAALGVVSLILLLIGMFRMVTHYLH